MIDSIKIVSKLTPSIMTEIDRILGNKPVPRVSAKIETNFQTPIQLNQPQRWWLRISFLLNVFYFLTFSHFSLFVVHIVYALCVHVFFLKQLISTLWLCFTTSRFKLSLVSRLSKYWSSVFLTWFQNIVLLSWLSCEHKTHWTTLATTNAEASVGCSSCISSISISVWKLFLLHSFSLFHQLFSFFCLALF